MVAPRKYTDELRERATRMAIDARKNAATRTGAYKRVADQLGVHPEALLRTWVPRVEVDEGLRPGAMTTTQRVSRNSNAKSKSYAERTRF